MRHAPCGSLILVLLSLAGCDSTPGRREVGPPLEAGGPDVGLSLDGGAREAGEARASDLPPGDRRAAEVRPPDRAAAPDAAAGPSYFISPGGLDTNPGTAPGQPWRTFKHAIPRLSPGDTLVLLDGTYSGASSGYPLIDCKAGAKNGTAAQPITLRAQNERKAFLKGDGSASPLAIQGCSYWRLEGLRAENGDFASEATGGSVFVVNGSSHLVLRRLLGARNNRYKNSHVILVGGSSAVLVEECEVYHFHRHGIIGYASSQLTYRRCYANSRGHVDIGNGYRSGDTTTGDEGMSFYVSKDSLAENCISESVSQGFTIHADEVSSGETGIPDNNRYFGCVALASGSGFYLDSRCNGQSPCLGDHVVSNTRYQSCVSVGGEVGFAFIGGQGNEVLGCTSIAAKWQGVELVLSSGNAVNNNAALSSSGAARNTLALGPTGVGFYATGQSSWAFESCAASGSSQAYLPDDSHVLTPLAADPKLGGCRVYLPAGSPLKGAGKGGVDVGASLVYRYHDGALSTTKLWNQASGAFPCGAVVAGVNDDPAQSCVGVHARLNVGTNGCPVP